MEEIKVAVDHVNIKVGSGELFGLLGPNGAGKTTMIKMLCTLIYPTEGTALVNGYDIRKEGLKVRRSISTVLGPERGFEWRLSGRQNLKFLAAMHDVPRSVADKRIEELLKLLDMQKEADKVFQKYSMGQKRKLTLAKALLPDAAVLLLDEPTIGLDPTISREIRKFIKEKVVEEDGKTVLLTTHYMEEADQICDKIAIIHEGKIAAVGTPSEIKDMVKENVTVELRVKRLPNKHLRDGEGDRRSYRRNIRRARIWRPADHPNRDCRHGGSFATYHIVDAQIRRRNTIHKDRGSNP